MRWIPIVVCAVALAGAGAASALAQPAPAKPAAPQGPAHIVLPPVPKPLLPDAFAGWVASEPPKKITDAAQADPAAARRAQGVRLQRRHAGRLQAQRRNPHPARPALSRHQRSLRSLLLLPPERLAQGGDRHRRHLEPQPRALLAGNTLVDANFSRIGPMSGSELRELAGLLPLPDGTARSAPAHPGQPAQNLPGRADHALCLGPAGYAGAGGVLPPALVGFDRGAEAVTANYSLRSGPATLTIIDYPTPQMAAAQETDIRAYIKAGSQAQPAWPKPLQDSDLASLEVRRSGPLVAIVSGDAIPDESHKLLATGALRGRPHLDPAAHRVRGGQDRPAAAGHRHPGASSAPAPPFCWDFSSAAAGRCTAWRAASRISSVYEEEFIRLDLREECGRTGTNG